MNTTKYKMNKSVGKLKPNRIQKVFNEERKKQ